MNSIVTKAKGCPALGIKPYPVLVIDCIIDKKTNTIIEFCVNTDIRKDILTGKYRNNPSSYFTFNPFFVEINNELKVELERCKYVMPIDTVVVRPQKGIRRVLKENGKMESECPSFMEAWDCEAIECKQCSKAFQDEYAMCKRETILKKEHTVVEQTPSFDSTEPVEPVLERAIKEFKGFRPGSRAAVLLDYLRLNKKISYEQASDYIAQKFNIDKKFSLEGIKAYLGEWVRGKWSGQDQNFPFIIVINDNIIEYKDKGD
jgi:hypothetical protein